jgi:peptidoglycan/xylan/chitin deacetylase (PgdA/CDA1 family)
MKAALHPLRLAARSTWVWFLEACGCLAWAERQLRKSGAVVVLTFHRVLDDDALQDTNSLPGIIIRENTFRDCLHYISENTDPVVLSDATPGQGAGRLRIGITFDDGWRDNYTTALPILRVYRLPVTIFVCPALSGKAAPFWPERVIALLRKTKPGSKPAQFASQIEMLKRKAPEERDCYLAALRERVRADGTIETFHTDRTLPPDEMLEMSRKGIGFGSHTHTHQILTTISEASAREELRGSKVELELLLGRPCGVFAYPNGNWSPETRRVVEQAGFMRAVTTQCGAWTPTTDPLAIPRVNVCEDNVVDMRGVFWPAMFRYTVLWKAWLATRRLTRRVRVEELGVPVQTAFRSSRNT